MTSIYTDPCGLCTIYITPVAVAPRYPLPTDGDSLYRALMPIITDMLTYWWRYGCDVETPITLAQGKRINQLLKAIGDRPLNTKRGFGLPSSRQAAASTIWLLEQRLQRRQEQAQTNNSEFIDEGDRTLWNT